MLLKKNSLIVFIITVAIGFFGCQQNTERQMPETQLGKDSVMADAEPTNTAVAVLSPTQGNNVHGEVVFTKTENGIKVVADIEGLKPGKHGFHIHENGDCSAPDGSSAGGHFAPLGHKHGAPTDAERHVGDMGNIEAGSDGKVHFEWTDSLMSFSGQTSIIGKAVIVHGGADDLKSQPSGNAGPRVACGVIKWENEVNEKHEGKDTLMDVD